MEILDVVLIAASVSMLVGLVLVHEIERERERRRKWKRREWKKGKDSK